MKPKQVLSIILIAFVVGSVGFMVVKELITKTPIDSENSADGNTSQKDQLIVYYFHGEVRCPTCHNLETYAKEALDTYFADELNEKKIIFKPVNIDKAENKHFIKDYQLISKSVVLSKIVDSKEIDKKNLDQIWQKVGDKDAYLDYIRSSIEEFNKGREL